MSRALALLSMLALALAGCAALATESPTSPTTLRWGVVGVADVPTLDPALVSDPTSISVVSLIYGGLVRLDGRLRVRPDGARRWTISPDGTTYTFYLRHNLRFPDGRRVTAADFKAALERALGPEGSSGTAPFYLSDIAFPFVQRGRSRVPGIEVLGANRLRIYLRRPAAQFLAELAFPVSFVPDLALVRRYGQAWTDHAAGFGPYRVASWEHGRSLELVRNPYYWGGQPHIRRITLRFYGDAGSALTAYRERKLDLVSGFQPGQAPLPRLAGVARVPALAMDYLAFNTTRFPFHHINARRVFAEVVPSSLPERVMGGTVFPADGFLPRAFDLAVPSWRPTRRPGTYLRMAHYTSKKPLPDVTFALPQDPHVDALGVALKNAWERAFGVTVLLHQLNAATYGEVLKARVFDLAIVRWGGDYPDVQDFLGTQLGASPDNVTGWTTRQYDRLVRRARSLSPTDPARLALYRAAARLAAQKLPILALDIPAQTAVISPRLSGVELTPLGTIDGDWAHAQLR